eukprot:Gb_35296 [translate_table: standard]
MDYLVLLFVLLSSSFLLRPSRSHHHSKLNNLSDQNALLGFKASITHDPNNALHNWNPSILSFCNWTGVGCSLKRERVATLNVTGMALQGSISPLLGNLSFLKVVDLSANNFNGRIPYQLGRLFRLRKLQLCKNQLEGSIPSSLAACRSLQTLYLTDNYLTESIPPELGHLTELQILWLQRNNLTGTIPASLANLSSSLLELLLHENQLTGHIPAELGLLTQLNFISLELNQLTGHIPASLSNCTSLQYLYLPENQLTGYIPGELCRLSQLLMLSLMKNQLTGQIPVCLSNITNLGGLVLYENQLTGHIPAELGQIPHELCQLTELYLISLGRNHFIGPIPPCLSQLTNLQELYLWGNRHSGNIPSSLSNCTQLQILVLFDNNLSGTVPLELGKLLLLERLYLNSNQLVSGSSNTFLPILTALTNCSLLQKLALDDNHLTGFLPSSIGHLSTKLSTLELNDNEIGGKLPHQIGNLTNLTVLALHGNLLKGSIPSTLNRFSKIERLSMERNKLEGSIPMEIGQIENLGHLSLQQNMLSGQIPDAIGNLPQLRRLYLSQNQLSGNIPASLGKCRTLEVLDLSYNNLTGNIPPQVAGLPNLVFYLNLSNNFIQGSLPLEISKMVMVQAMDISANQLSGVIPSTQLGSCIALQYLNFSWNALEGPIPNSLGELRNRQDMDFSFNNLSGAIPNSLQKLTMLRLLNFSQNNLSGEVPRRGIFAKLNAAAFMKNSGLWGPWVNLPPCPLPTHHDHSLLKKELLTATQGFCEANLVGVGCFGRVYKGVLSDGTMVAVKVLNLQNEEAHTSFARECKVLRRVRHRNIISILTSCSNLDFKSLVIPFMSNGSLNKCLYSDGDHVCGLSLTQRLNIALDIAQGMAYLHHDCFLQVVHCDLKPSNVPLDHNMKALVADFGIARLTGGNSMDSFTSTLGLLGSVGYIAPEYGLGGKPSTKGDVYSYGILLLELLTRKRPTDHMFAEGLNMHKWASADFPNRMMEVVDKLPEERPIMREVVTILERIRGAFVGIGETSVFPKDMSSLLASTSYLLGASGSHTSSSTL